MTAIRSDFQNAFETQLTVEMGPNDLTAVVTSKGALAEPVYLVIDPDNDALREYIFFNTDTPQAGQFSCGTGGIANRYLAGSAAGSNLTHSIGAVVRMVPAAQHFEDLHDRIDGISHGTLQGLANDDHTQYPLADGSRGFSAPVTVGEPSVATDAATKAYVDAQVAGGVPSGLISAYGGSSAPGGYLLCDGAEVSRATYNDLFLAIGTVYGVGDGSTTFNVPDLRGRFPLGKADAGTGSTLGDTGGQLDPTIDLAHTHGLASHTHSINHGHADTFATAAVDPGDTNSAGAHTHTGPSHTHSIDHNHPSLLTSITGDHTHVVSDTTSGPSQTTNVSNASPDIAVATSSHTHGTSDTSTTEGDHQHTVDLPNLTGTSGSGGTGATSSNGAHTHTMGTHSHSITGAVTDLTGNSGAAAGNTDSGLSDGFSVPNAPFLAVNFIIKT